MIYLNNFILKDMTMQNSQKVLLSIMASMMLFVGCGTQKSTRSSLDTLSHVAQKSSIDFNDGAIHLDNGQLLQLDATKEVFDVKDITLYTWTNQNGEIISCCHEINIPLSYHDSQDEDDNGLNKYIFTVTAENALCESDAKTFTVYVHRDKKDDAVAIKYDTPQALLGPLSGANVRIEMLSDREVDDYAEFLVYEGKTTVGDGQDVQSAGRIELPQSIKDSLTQESYVVSISGGEDIDRDDNLVWDINPIQNRGTIHAVISKEDLLSGDYKVNILTEIAYKVAFYGNHKDRQYKMASGADTRMDTIAKALLREDIDGDGDIDYHDILVWSPLTDKEKLAVNYDRYLKGDVESILHGERYEHMLNIYEISLGEVKHENGLTKHLYERQEFWYNTQGNMTKHIITRGELYYEQTLTYSTEGKLQKTVADRGAGTGMHTLTIREYDQYENPIKEEYLYSERGGFQENGWVPEDGFNRITTWKYAYNEMGHILSQERTTITVEVPVFEIRKWY
jgi:hypothetical protein